MNSFPPYLIPQENEKFESYMEHFILYKIREAIYSFILKGNEDDYFILDKHYREYNIHDSELAQTITDKLTHELNNLGWKTKKAFGGSSLYIYSKEPHKSAYFEDM